MQQYLFFQACKKSEALGETVDTSKKWRIFSTIKKSFLLTRTIDTMVDEKAGNFSAEDCLKELNGNFLPDYAYGKEVGDTFTYRHSKGFNAYSDSVMKGSTEQFYKDWDAKTAEIKADQERLERQYREAEERVAFGRVQKHPQNALRVAAVRDEVAGGAEAGFCDESGLGGEGCARRRDIAHALEEAV